MLPQAEYRCANEAAMLQLGAQLAKQIEFGSVVYLQGDLGAGKTTLVRGFLVGLGYTGHVKSPTFTLVEPYEFALGQVYHFDLYRLEQPDELLMLGLRDMLSEHSICLFEWPEKAQGVLPSADYGINIDIIGELRIVRLFTDD